ncbi:hypothetical protein AAEP80_03205 [Curtobacterium sp. L3-7]|uniref:hypothetical protein n=1 Tax=Curtobacterium sp. L3-7 TaxID=3138787 RepID=UPI003B52A351
MTDAGPHRRPTIVTVAVALIVVRAVTAAVGPGPARGGALLPAEVVAVLLYAAITWAVFRTAAGSRRARVALVVVAAARAVLGFALAPLPLALIALTIVATVLLFLPAARPWFPRAPRPARAQRASEPETIGWDPETGDRILRQD